MAAYCFPPLHRRHLSLSVFRILSFRYGPIAASSNRNQKYRPATVLRVRRSCLRLRPFPGGLHIRSGPTRGRISVATLVMCDRLVAERSEIMKVRTGEAKAKARVLKKASGVSFFIRLN